MGRTRVLARLLLSPLEKLTSALACFYFLSLLHFLFFLRAISASVFSACFGLEPQNHTDFNAYSVPGVDTEWVTQLSCLGFCALAQVLMHSGHATDACRNLSRPNALFGVASISHHANYLKEPQHKLRHSLSHWRILRWWTVLQGPTSHGGGGGYRDSRCGSWDLGPGFI